MKTHSFILPAVVVVLMACRGGEPLAPKFLDGLSAAKAVGNVLAAPSNASAVSTASGSVTITWQDNSSNEGGFEVHRSLSPAGTFVLVATVPPNTTGYSDTGRDALTQYCYQVRAFRSATAKRNNSGFSNVSCATTLPYPPDPVQSLWAAPLDSTTVHIRWSNYSFVSGFRVYRSPDAGASWALATTTTSTEAVDTGVPDAELGICYHVVSFNAGGESAPSSSACTFQPAAATNVSLTVTDSVRVSWSDNSAAEDTYQVWVQLGWGNCPPGSGGCDAGMTIVDYLIASLPANTTRFSCSGCLPSLPPGSAGYGSLWISAIRNGVESGSVAVGFPPE